jgi:hypothetical protein
MSEAETADFIRAHPVGVLCLVDGDRPYAVALEHYYDGENLYFGTSTREDQRKVRCLKQNARACYVIYESRREDPSMVQRGIPCRSVLIEGTVGIAGIKRIESREYGPVRLQMLKLSAGETSNWQCLRKRCDWQERWYERYPELTADL